MSNIYPDDLYVLDQIDKGDEVRLSFHIGDETLSRVYRVLMEGGDARFVPQGFWTRKRGDDLHE